ncbi:MAG: lipopolysaccharide kinase InaA family protein [Planctomycetota bacterium]|nr:lipopolysaccharide kinase InaA family protein [Planctomycetota bacterium]
MSALFGPDPVLELLRHAGIRTVDDVLRASTWSRDLKKRANLVLDVGGRHVHVKFAKKARRAREAEALAKLQSLRVPTAAIAFSGVDPEHGAVTGTLDLAPARPLDDLLREGALDAKRRRRLTELLADAVGTLHDGGYNHRDLYLNHVFADPDAEPLGVAIIDLERLRRHRRLLGPRVVKDLAALLSSVPDGTLSELEQARFLVRYMARRNIPRRGVYAGLVRRIRRKAARIRRHVPRTPVGEAARPKTGTA